MRLLFDAQCVQSSSSLRGIGRYSLCLLRALVEGRGEHQVEVLLNAGDDADRLLRARAALETFLPPGAVHVFDADWPWRHPRSESRRRAAEAVYAAAVESLQPDTLLVGSVIEGDDENVLGSGEGALDVPTAAVLYDLIPAADPSTYLLGPAAPVYWRRVNQLAQASLLLSISDYSAGQAQELLGTRCPRLATVWGGPYPSGAFPAFEEQSDDRPYVQPTAPFLLTVGGDHPRKNLDRLVEAFARVPVTCRAGTPLVIACGLSQGTERRLRRIAARGGLGAQELVITGRVSEQRLGRLYREALAFVFPSTLEGLGMPPIEAMAAGCPTVMARSSSLVELAEDDAVFFNGESVDDVSAALVRVLQDASLRERLRSEGRRSAARLSWESTAGRAWRALEALPVLETRSPGTVRDVPSWTAVPSGAAARADSALPVAGGAPAVREALAGVPALVASPGVSAALVSHGVVDTALVPADQVERVVAHDPVPRLAVRLPAVGLPPEQAHDLVRALSRPPRWTLQRARPVGLLLTIRWLADAEELRSLAREQGMDLVVAAPGAEALARSVDVVAAEHGAVELDRLLSARARGAVVFVVDAAEDQRPWWCRAATSRNGWESLLRELSVSGRTCGWPWRG